MKFGSSRAAFTPAALLLLALPLLPARAPAQATPLVDPVEPVYRVLDRLVWEGLIDTVIVGQRPVSRREIARRIAEASRNRGRLADRIASAGDDGSDDGVGALAARLARVDALLALVRPAYARELEALAGDHGRAWGVSARADRLTAEGTVLSSEPRTIPDVGLGGIDAVTNPLAAYRQGREYADGVTGRATVSGRAQLGRWAALSAGVEGWALDDRSGKGGGDRRVDALVNVLALATVIRNVHIEAGRDYLSWGQVERGGVGLSTNAPAVDMVRIGSDLPFTLPWLFRHAGPTRGTLFLADLGGAREFPHARLVGYQVSFLPHRRFELGVTVLTETGGRGAPPATFGDRLADVVPLIDVFFKANSDFLFSNKLAGVEMRYRVPAARGLELHGQWMLDDFDARRVRSSLWEDGGITGGFVLPRLTSDGAVRLEGSYHHTGLRFYQHGQFVSGLTLRRSVLGDALGPDGNGGYGALVWEPRDETTVELRGALESRSGDQYRIVTSGPDDAGFAFEKVVDAPEEIRRRLTIGVSHGGLARGVRLVGEGGVESVSHFGFAAEGRRTNGLLRLAVEVRP